MPGLGPTLATLTTLTAVALCGAAPARAQPAAGPAAAPKIAVVVVGDADARMRAAALRVEDALIVGALGIAEDAGLRAALRGEPAPAHDDGLAGVRRVRRSLGLGEAQDAPNLARLGRMAGASLVVAVRPDGHGGVQLVTLQVAAAQFYEGALDAESSTPERIVRAVDRRARHAMRAISTSEPRVPTATPTAASAQRDGAVRRARAHHAPSAATSPEAPHAERSFLEKSWPYFVAGALLAGCVTYVALDTTSGNQATPTPVLRFSPGP